MKTPLAWLNLSHDRTRTTVAVAGVAFAVVLILMQLGFYVSVLRSATQIYDQLTFDVLLVSPQYVFLSKAGRIPRARLFQAQDLPAIAQASAFQLGFGLWRNPETKQRRGIMILAVDPAHDVFELAEIKSGKQALAVRNNVLMDALSRHEFGPKRVGIETEVNRRKVRVVDYFTLGTGFGADGAILTSEETYFELVPQFSRDTVSMGLLTLHDGAEPDQVAEQLRHLLPKDVAVMTRAEISRHEKNYWRKTTSVGVIFGMGVVVALVVGTAIVYQVLSSDIANRLPEFATLKAMGYSPRYLTGVVLQQAVILAVAGFIPGLALSVLLYGMTRKVANLPIHMNGWLAVFVLGLSLAMCCISAMAALRKVNSADPADLFR